jgi:hypothetical protein
MPISSHGCLDGLGILHPKLSEYVLNVLCLADEGALLELLNESRLEGVNRAKLKFTKLITTTSRVSVRNIIKSVREGGKSITSE